MAGPDQNDEVRSREQKTDAPAGARRRGEGQRGGEDEICALCGSVLTAVRCELICSNCGYREDCSDIFPAS